MSDPVPPAQAHPAPATTPPFSEDRVLRVGGGTACKGLGAAIAAVIEKEKRRPVLEFVGAAACAQAVKAIAIANTFLSKKGIYLLALPVFVHREFTDNHDATGMQLKLIINEIR